MPTIKNPLILRPMDVLHCGEPRGTPPHEKLWHKLTRLFTAGRNRISDKTVAVHTAIVYQLYDQLVAVEMIGLRQGLRMSSLELTHDRRPREVIAVSRYAIYDDAAKREAAMKRIAYDLRKTVEYDPKGCLEFAFKRLQDDPRRRICSEYFYIHAKLDGHKFPDRFETRVSPWDLQTYCTAGISLIEGW